LNPGVEPGQPSKTMSCKKLKKKKKGNINRDNLRMTENICMSFTDKEFIYRIYVKLNQTTQINNKVG
jgi:hypothetical protein